MSFANAWWDSAAELDGLICKRCTLAEARAVVASPIIPLVSVPVSKALAALPCHVLVEARLAKRSVPASIRGLAPLTIGLGPGFEAGGNCDIAIETQWGPRLGAVIRQGGTAPLAGEPRPIDGIGRERNVYAAQDGQWRTSQNIGQPITEGQVVAYLDDTPVTAPLAGTIRGLLRDGLTVSAGDKVLEIDPRPLALALFAGIGARPATIAQGVLAAIA